MRSVRATPGGGWQPTTPEERDLALALLKPDGDVEAAARRLVESDPDGSLEDEARYAEAIALGESGARPEAPDPRRVESHADTGLYLGADVDAVYAYLKARGHEVAPPVTRDYGARQLELVDPDGYVVVLAGPDGESA